MGVLVYLCSVLSSTCSIPPSPVSTLQSLNYPFFSGYSVNRVDERFDARMANIRFRRDEKFRRIKVDELEEIVRTVGCPFLSPLQGHLAVAACLSPASLLIEMLSASRKP